MIQSYVSTTPSDIFSYLTKLYKSINYFKSNLYIPVYNGDNVGFSGPRYSFINIVHLKFCVSSHDFAIG